MEVSAAAAVAIDLRYLIETEDLFEPGKVEEICALIQDREVSILRCLITPELKQNLIFQLQLNSNLEDILAKQCHFEARLRSVGKAISGLTTAQNNAGELRGMINHTSELSENVSMKVRRLDEARVSG